MKLQFEIDDRFAKELKDTCMLFNGIDLDNTEEIGCSVALLNHDAFICKGFLKNGCPLKLIEE